MGLKELYEEKTASTGVLSKVGEQASGLAGNGVDFMDGQPRRTAAEKAAGDIFQTEFKKQAIGTNLGSGAQGTNGMISSWTDKALKLAFENNQDGPTSLINGYYNTLRFRVAKPTDSTMNIHKYQPVGNYNASQVGGYINQFGFAKARYASRPTSG